LEIGIYFKHVQLFESKYSFWFRSNVHIQKQILKNIKTNYHVFEKKVRIRAEFEMESRKDKHTKWKRETKEDQEEKEKKNIKTKKKARNEAK
jgi:hypothetical protein